jgi:hypothetical protein
MPNVGGSYVSDASMAYYEGLLRKCKPVLDAMVTLRGFSGASALRDTYVDDFNARCKGQQPPQTTPPPTQPAPSGDKIACKSVTNSEWFCNFKFPSTAKKGNDSTEKTLQACQDRCFEDKTCGGWSLRQKDGLCHLFTTSGKWPYKDQMKRATGWIAGPRWDTKQGPIGGGETDSPVTESPSTTSPVTTTPYPTDTRSDLQKLWDKHKTLIIIGTLVCVFLVFAGSSMILALVM